LVDLAEQGPEVGVALLALEQLQRLGQREAGTQQRSQLGVEQQEVLRRNLVATRQERDAQAGAGGRHAEDVESLPLELSAESIVRHRHSPLLHDGTVRRPESADELRHLLLLGPL
jgi:hypothetical protein